MYKTFSSRFLKIIPLFYDLKNWDKVSIRWYFVFFMLHSKTYVMGSKENLVFPIN